MSTKIRYTDEPLGKLRVVPDHAVYVLHCFQKKSPSGRRTARTDVEIIHRRLAAARADCEMRYGEKT